MQQLIYVLGLYFKDRAMIAANVIAVVGLVVSGWTLSLKIDQLPQEVPLWYTAEPINQLVAVDWLWLISGIVLVIWLVNLVIGLWLYRRFATVSQMLAVVAAACSLLGLIAVVKTILIFTDLI